MTGRKSQPSTKPPKLNMMQIVADIHDRTEVPKEYISAVLRGFKELVKDSMIAGIDLDLGGDFGRFTAIEVAGREHYVPATGGTTQTPVRRKIRFRPAPSLRNLAILGESEKGGEETISEALERRYGTMRDEVIDEFLQEPGKGRRTLKLYKQQQKEEPSATPVVEEPPPTGASGKEELSSIFDDIDLPGVDVQEPSPKPRKTRKKMRNSSVWSPSDIK